MKGEQLIEIAKGHLGEPYVLGSLAPKDSPNYKGPWDCAELASYTIFQLTHQLYGCANNSTRDVNSADSYTGYLDRDAKKLGKIITVDNAAVTPGALIMRVAANGMTGHVVFSQGTGNSTVEAHSHVDGVIESVIKGRRWDYGILIPWITYVQLQAPIIIPAPKVRIYRLAAPQMKDPEITLIQMKLDIPADGIYGPGTFQAVRAFQAKKGLVADGEVGPETMKALGLV